MQDLLQPWGLAPYPGTLSYDDVPSYVRQPHVLQSYRPSLEVQGRPLRAALLDSLVRTHCEWLNVWSHLLGSCWAAWQFACLDVSTAVPYTATFLVASLICFTASTVAHLVGPLLSRPKCAAVWAVDHLGIAILMGGCYLPSLSFGFRTMPTLKTLYTEIIVALLAVAVISTAMVFRFGLGTGDEAFKRMNESIRVRTLIATAVFGLVPLAHFALVGPPEETALFVPRILIMLSLYLIGLLFFLTRLPESAHPGRFDIWFSSHFLWHTFVFTGVCHYHHTIQHMSSFVHGRMSDLQAGNISLTGLESEPR